MLFFFVFIYYVHSANIHNYFTGVGGILHLRWLDVILVYVNVFH